MWAIDPSAGSDVHSARLAASDVFCYLSCPVLTCLVWSWFLMGLRATLLFPAPHVQVRLLMEMLNADPWRYFPLTLHFTSSQHVALASGCLPLLSHMTTSVGPLTVSMLDTSSSCHHGRVPHIEFASFQLPGPCPAT